MVSRIWVTPLGRLRLAEEEDAPDIKPLINESMANTFRIHQTDDIITLIQNAVISVCQFNNEDELVGFLAAREFPLIPCLHSSAWEDYIWTKYRVIDMNARNTLFLHLICWSPKYSRDIVDNMLRSIFMHDPYIQNIGMVKTNLHVPLLVPGQARAEASFRRVGAMERGMSGDMLPALFIAERREICPRLRVRRAVEEDNDDIVPIIERHAPRLREMYGEFYISELVSRHPESERVLLVCEHKELAVGVMCLNTQINFEMLEECFDLSPFAGLRHINEHPDVKPELAIIDDNVVNPVSDASVCQIEASQTLLATDDVQNKDSKSRVTCMFEEEEFKEVSKLEHNEESVPYSNILDLFADEDEEVDFDIINIDSMLLKTAQLISYVPSENVYKNVLDGRQEELKKDKIEPITDGRAEKKTEKKRQNDRFPIVSAVTIAKADTEVHRFTGQPNAFLLELFAMQPEYDERYGFDMLEAAYELFPNRDYCISCVPSKQPSFPLLEHFTLVTPFGSRFKFANESLYVAHVNSVRGAVHVRMGEAADLKYLKDILEYAPRRDVLTELFQTSFSSMTIDSYILLAQSQPIGVVIIGPLENGTTIRTQYKLEPEPHMPGSDGTILAAVMSPALEPHSRWYMRDVMRRSRYDTLFWIAQSSAKGDSSALRNMMSLTERMVPVRPRRCIPNITGNENLDNIFAAKLIPFSLWVMDKPLSCLPKLYVNNSIVVVGASSTGLAFLETLIMGYLTFTNITLVSENGLPSVPECLKAADKCVPREGRYTDHYVKSIPFSFYVDVMTAVMVAIDRKKKCIHLKGGGVKFYDELVLTCGQQFQHPDYMKDSLKLAKKQKNKVCERMLMDNPKYRPDRVPPPPDLPENVMLINSLHQANSCFRKLLRMMNEDRNSLKDTNQIVVYGDCLEAYCCMNALLELGVQPEEIAFVEPFPADENSLRVNCFNDETVDERVQHQLVEKGIQVYRKTRLVQWKLFNNRVVFLRLMSPLHCIKLPCFALFYYGLKAIDLYAFKAINECGLVYDGGLVVGPAFETNDPHVYGAGTCVQYSRRLYATQLLHRNYCSEDIGEALANLFLYKLDPFVMCNPDFSSYVTDLVPRWSSSLLLSEPHPSIPNMTNPIMKTCLSRRYILDLINRVISNTHNKYFSITYTPLLVQKPVVKFTSPLMRTALLPGPLYYLKLIKPGPEIPMEVQMSLPRQGHVLITDKHSNYFRLQLNILHCVDAATCLSNKKFYPELVLQLYGKHEAFFNKLLTRYQIDQIDDLYKFFTQPWLSAVYHDTFDELLTNIDNQEVDRILELLMNKSLEELDAREHFKSTISQLISPTSTFDIAAEDSQVTKKMGNFRSILEKYVGSVCFDANKPPRTVDIPSECGQSLRVRNEVARLWDAVGGDRVVFAHIARHISRNSIVNPHYAPPDPKNVYSSPL